MSEYLIARNLLIAERSILHGVTLEAALSRPKLPKLGATVLVSFALGDTLSIALQPFVDLDHCLLSARPRGLTERLPYLLSMGGPARNYAYTHSQIRSREAPLAQRPSPLSNRGSVEPDGRQPVKADTPPNKARAMQI